MFEGTGSVVPMGYQKANGLTFSFVDLENIRLGLNQFLERKKVPEDRRKIFSVARLIQNFHSDRFFVYSATLNREQDDPLIQSLRAEQNFIFKGAKLTVNGGRRKQQGVDVLMAIEALKHAHSKNMAACHIFSGDGDFLPLLEALVDQGVIVTTISFGDPSHSEVASSLRDASDIYYHIGSKILSKSMADSFNISSTGSGNATTLLRDSHPLETCFPELNGRVFKQDNNSILLTSRSISLEMRFTLEPVTYITFQNQDAMEEWYRINRES